MPETAASLFNTHNRPIGEKGKKAGCFISFYLDELLTIKEVNARNSGQLVQHTLDRLVRKEIRPAVHFT